jgi:flagellar protein FlaG
MNIQPVNISALSNVAVPPQNLSQGAGTTPDALLSSATATTQQAPPPTKETQPSREQLDKAVKTVNDFVSAVNNAVEFTVDKDTGKTVIKVVDTTTKQVIKQFPSEEMLAIAKALDGIKGLLVHQKA